MTETKISKGFQTVVPSEIRKRFNVGPGDVMEWITTTEGVKIRFRKKVSLLDIAGIGKTKEKTNAVELKKRAQRGEKM
jgi:AbrB family looped-hinge helix DNA binding protein